MPDGGDPSSLGDMARRLQRIEDRLDERIATTDMLRATEKLFEAKTIGQMAELHSLRERVNKVESAAIALTRMVIVAFLGLLIQLVVLVVSATSKGGGP